MLGFERVAALVRTKVGILQANRLCAGQASAFGVFDDEAAAIASLLGEGLQGDGSAEPPAR